MSYRNLMLYSRALPHYDDEKEDVWDEAINADNPDNFAQCIDEEKIYRYN